MTHTGPRSAAQQLRDLLQSRRSATALEAHDAVSAQLVGECGFDAIWASSLTLSATHGYRDRSELSMGEALSALECITRKAQVPVLFDADTGYGDAEHFALLAARLVQRGVAGACIEDKRFPKVNSLLAQPGDALAPVGELCAKLRAGRAAAPELVLVARTEALIVGAPMDEALARARAYAAAGADAVLVHSKAGDLGEITAFAAAWTGTVPLVIVPTTYAGVQRRDFEALGLGLVIWANHMLRASIQAMQQFAASLVSAPVASALDSRLAPLPELFRLTGDATTPTTQAVILAAGMGTRLGELGSQPKGLLEVAGASLVERAIALLEARGIQEIRLVVGYEAQAYAALAARHPSVVLVHNPDYATTGTLQSLRCALQQPIGSFLLLESDLFYEQRALDALLFDTRPDVLLASGLTGATDEVWVESSGGRLRKLSKDRNAVASIDGEMVGLCKLSARAASALRALPLDANASYETDALVRLGETLPIAVRVEPNLLWGEVDDLNHLRRVREQVAPVVALREGRGE